MKKKKHEEKTNKEKQNKTKQGIIYIMNKQEIQDRADSFSFPFMPQGLDMCISGFSSSAALIPKDAVSCLMEDLAEQGGEKKMRKEKKGREEIKAIFAPTESRALSGCW